MGANFITLERDVIVLRTIECIHQAASNERVQTRLSLNENGMTSTRRC